MEQRLYTPQEIADILKIKKNTVYDMIKRGSLNAVKMGKQLRISSSDINAFLNKESITANDNPSVISQTIAKKDVQQHGSIVVCGQDIVLDMLCSAVNSSIGSSRLLRSYSGSFDGLLELYHEEVQIASAHLWDMETDSYNLPFIKALLPGEHISVYHILKRPVYIYTAQGNPKSVTSVKDFARNDISIVNRERGSGIRVLTDALLTVNNISPSDVNGYGRIVNSHLAAASVISRGGADCAIGNAAAAMQFPNIEKVFLKYEEYDMVLRKSDETLPEIKLMINILCSDKFRDEVSSIGSYDTSGMGVKLL